MQVAHLQRALRDKDREISRLSRALRSAQQEGVEANVQAADACALRRSLLESEAVRERQASYIKELKRQAGAASRL